MNSTQGMKMSLTRHALTTCLKKGFDPEKVKDTFANPTEVYPSGSHPGQYRVTGNGICLVGVPEGNTFRVITMYADRILTAVRADQMNTPEGRRYAARRAAGLGRG